MKRTIAIILTVLLLVSSAFALAACVVSSSGDWDNASDKFKTADAVTVKIKDDNLTMGYLVNREHLVCSGEIAFDATQGVLYIVMNTSRGTGFIDVDPTKGTDEWYYVIDGTTVNCYHRHTSQYSEGEWEASDMTFTTKDEAVEFLRDKYLHPVDIDEKAIPTFLDMGYRGEEIKSTNNAVNKVNLFKNKFTLKYSDDRFAYTYVMKFSLKGDVSKYTYKHKSAERGHVDDKRTTTITVKYEANITLPSDLPKA